MRTGAILCLLMLLTGPAAAQAETGDDVLFAPPYDDVTDRVRLRYDLGWYGASCLGYALASWRVRRELGLDSGPGEPGAYFDALVAQDHGWEAVDLLLHAQDKSAHYAPLFRIVLPLSMAGKAVPAETADLLRAGQAECQMSEQVLLRIEHAR